MSQRVKLGAKELIDVFDWLERISDLISENTTRLVRLESWENDVKRFQEIVPEFWQLKRQVTGLQSKVRDTRLKGGIRALLEDMSKEELPDGPVAEYVPPVDKKEQIVFKITFNCSGCGQTMVNQGVVEAVSTEVEELVLSENITCEVCSHTATIRGDITLEF